MKEQIANASAKRAAWDQKAAADKAAFVAVAAERAADMLAEICGLLED